MSRCSDRSHRNWYAGEEHGERCTARRRFAFDSNLVGRSAPQRHSLHAGAGGDKLLFRGNGDSTSHSQHLAGECVGMGQSAIAPTADSAVGTALANDFGFEEVFALRPKAPGTRGDLLLSTRRQPLREPGERHRKIGSCIVVVTGGGGALVDRSVDLPSLRTYSGSQAVSTLRCGVAPPEGSRRGSRGPIRRTSSRCSDGPNERLPRSPRSSCAP